MKREYYIERISSLTEGYIVDIIKNSTSLSESSRLLFNDDSSNARKFLKELIEKYSIEFTGYYERKKYCLCCGKEITGKDRLRKTFCSHACSATYNNLQRGAKYDPNYCLNCGEKIGSLRKFCSNKCQSEYEYKTYIERWKNGDEEGTSGKDDISGYVVRYFREKYNNSCQICGWNETNKYTGKVPLQLHHIDGDCLNNSENNLQLLCPNHHSLTENFGSRNKNCTRIDKRKR